MKKVSLFSFAILFTVFVTAQQNNLKSINLETSDRNLFVYESSEIEEISKENLLNNSQKRNAFSKNHNERRGYIGLSIGPSFALGDLSNLPVGVTLNLVDFGYLFTDNFGIAGKWLGSAFSESGIDYGAGGLLGGLLASTAISPNLNLEGKILIGAALFSVKYAGFSYTTDYYFGYDIGGGLRYNTSDKISLLLNADYLGSEDFRSFNLTVGVAYRLK